MKILSFILAVNFVFLSSVEKASAQQCKMSGKRIEYRGRMCSDSGCHRIRDNVVFVGERDRVIRYDENPNTGMLYYIGRTVEYTERDVPNARKLLAEQGGGNAKISATAVLAGNMLGLRQTATYFFRTGPIQVHERADIEISSCATCRVKNLEQRIPNAPPWTFDSHISCEITDAR